MIRWLTALTIICVGGLTAAWGWEAAEFARVRASVLYTSAGEASINAWSNVPGLRADALERLFYAPTGAALAPALREAQLTALVAARPMSGQEWLSLAGERFVLASPKAKVDAAVAMSRLTGPNEGALMWQRGLFELVRWQTLSTSERSQAVADLAGAFNGGIANDTRIRLAKAILVQQLPTARAEIATALKVAGLTTTRLTELGLRADRG